MLYDTVMRNGRNRSVWEEKAAVIEAFSSSSNMTEIIKTLGLPTGSASYRNCKMYAERYGLNIPKVSGAQRTKNARASRLTPLEEVLVVNSTYANRQKLKARLIGAGLLKDECGVCGLGPVWNGKPITLQLDHINGVGNDNRLENLMVVCPNCHTQTSTFAGRNVSIRRGVTRGGLEGS